ncbi:MAG: glutamyl-tRNA reductase [Acidobacteria bacterium]|nr:MAG: glutamyl-tRNA reductase [Acidobacteriota bacterium]
MAIVLIGLNHRTAPVELRERVSFTQEAARLASEQLRSRGVLSETVVLSTCNRSELYGVPPESASSAKDSAGAMELFLATFHRIEPAVLNGSLYRRHDREAVRHLFRVAAGLDSMMLGEAEILGQIREAYRIAVDHGGTGPVLNRMFQSALEVGKRVRAETQISARPMSVAFAGVKLAERIFGSLRSHSALILGAGSTGEQVVAHLRDRGISRLGVANRSLQRAAELAERFGAEVVDWEALDSALVWPDTVICSVTSSEPVVSRVAVERAMAARSNRSLLFIDLGVPRNVSAGAAELYNVYLYGVDDLKEIVEQNKRAREAEVPKVELLVEEHVTKFESWQAGVEASAVLRELRSRLGAEREDFLREKLSGMLHLSPDDKRRIAALMDELLDRVLLEPAEKLKTVPDVRRRVRNLEALRDLFRLDQDKS